MRIKSIMKYYVIYPGGVRKMSQTENEEFMMTYKEHIQINNDKNWRGIFAARK